MTRGPYPLPIFSVWYLVVGLVVCSVFVVVCSVFVVGSAGVVAGAEEEPVSASSNLDVAVSEATVSDSATAVVHSCAVEPPSDYADPDGGTASTIGWVDGYWYDEPIDVDVEDGLSESELEKLGARTAARIEAMRCLPAVEGVPPVTILSREDLAQSNTGSGGAVTDSTQFENAKFETLLMIDERTDVRDVQSEQRSEITGGWYDFIAKEITIISDDPDSLLIDEALLAHEIGHAIQDQHFNLSRYERLTTDEDRGNLGLIEGDVHLLEQRYLDACETGVWEQPCLLRDGSSDDDTVDEEETSHQPSIPNWGLFLKTVQPYSDGPSFVEYIYEERGGWSGVNQVYEEPPDSALEIARPELYQNVSLVTASVPDRSASGWERIERPAVGPTYRRLPSDTIGIAGITAMFAQPTLETGGQESILRITDFQNFDRDGRVDSTNPFNYVVPETEGWRGDAMYVYRSDEGDTATVWQLVWESPEDAQPFVAAYEELLQYRGAEAVEEWKRTYTLENASEYDMAVTIGVEADTVTIVTAPTVDDLETVHEGILEVEPDGASGDDSTSGTPGDSDSDSTGEPGDEHEISSDGDSMDVEPSDGESSDGPDGGLVVVGVALAGALLILSVILLDVRRWE